MPPNPVSNGREPNGRFTTGNGFSRGNPLSRRVNRLRAELLRAVTPQDVRDVVQVLLAKAKGGDVAAARELLNRALGKPVAPVELSGPDGERLGTGLSLADVQLAIVEALADEPGARVKVAQALKELHERHRATADGPAP
jgi:hypothetical protein